MIGVVVSRLVSVQYVYAEIGVQYGVVFVCMYYGSGECGVYAIAAAAFTLAERNVYTLNDKLVAVFRKFCACSLWSQSWMLD
ncbi:hypothetical protein F511_46591 [Dorcoceras hygrometricum]|uniref:Uncharacterized protein n=1 Tax=Dorcoceras hygrometricum TaxID=472368 RepID=A0A2Z6ZT57_9LAMI|nr:hypothetical protein F511_46591 [Dorcoceras hygrometricum]